MAVQIALVVRISAVQHQIGILCHRNRTVSRRCLYAAVTAARKNFHNHGRRVRMHRMAPAHLGPFGVFLCLGARSDHSCGTGGRASRSRSARSLALRNHAFQNISVILYPVVSIPYMTVDFVFFINVPAVQYQVLIRRYGNRAGRILNFHTAGTAARQRF